MKSHRKKIIILAAALLLAAGTMLLVAGVKTMSRRPGTNSTPRNVSADTLIATLRQRLESSPHDEVVSLQLASAYLQKIRETADVAYYQKIDELLKSAGAINKDNSEISALRATVALGRHHFREAGILGEQLVTHAPRTPRYYGILADASLELGRYDEAAAALQKMVDLRPDFNSFSRISYLRELSGDVKGAVQAMEQAIIAGAAFPENIAWAYTELGKLHLPSDRDKASKSFEVALRIKSDYPQALEGLGMVAFAAKDLVKAQEFFAKAYSTLPIAQFAVDLGNLALQQGDQTRAEQYLTLAKIAFDKSAASGVDTDLEYAVFLADHDKDLVSALERAQAGYKNRPGIFGADALAWALYKNGRYEEAARMAANAMALGEHTPATLFHAGMIEEALGHKERARHYFLLAHELYPHFSIQYSEVLEKKLKNY